MLKKIIITVGLFSLAFSVQANTPCNLNLSPLEQALCLLRPVKKYGNLSNQLSKLPSHLDEIIGKPIELSKQAFRQYLKENNIDESDLGGDIDEQLSKTNGGRMAQYFVFHDTSTPLPKLKPFPDEINQKGWRGNSLKSYRRNAHVFINRLGESSTKVNFKNPKLTTKFEVHNKNRVGLFLGIELVQPRRIDSRNSDWEAPNPGFTEPQLNRLALVYIAASLRKGSWLIPCYHAAVDAGIPQAHDDPQNFDLNDWAKKLGEQINKIKAYPIN